VHEYIKIVFGT